jgi:hypothetical protein
VTFEDKETAQLERNKDFVKTSFIKAAQLTQC